ncbi:hypothetical protein B0O80DRAFT_430198 [Mortierella sp. GBAus27b]|nr:hypothetical protein B0O80DRAFT_430198 [Mortierella sp. GBAus27b]
MVLLPDIAIIAVFILALGVVWVHPKPKSQVLQSTWTMYWSLYSLCTVASSFTVNSTSTGVKVQDPSTFHTPEGLSTPDWRQSKVNAVPQSQKIRLMGFECAKVFVIVSGARADSFAIIMDWRKALCGCGAICTRFIWAWCRAFDMIAQFGQVTGWVAPQDAPG